LIALEISGAQRSGIADAGGAAETHEVVAELVEILLQPGLVEIFRDHLRSGASEVLTQGLTVRPFATALRARSPARP